MRIVSEEPDNPSFARKVRAIESWDPAILLV
jgi:hypothetical protein